MDIYNAVLAQIAQQYEQEKDSTSEIRLILNHKGSDSGGYCEKQTFKANRLYKVIFPNPIPSPESFTICLSSDETGTRHYFNKKEVVEILTEYEHDNTSCFIKFNRDMAETSFFTNIV